MDITKDDLAAVEIAETDDSFLLYQIWRTEESAKETSMGNLAGQDELYHVNIVGELENPRKYGANFDSEATVRQVTEDYHEWVGDMSEDENVEAFVYGYDRDDPRDGDRPDQAARLSDYSDPELEEKLSAAFSGLPMSDM